MNEVSFLGSYLAGVITFFASCMLPLVPTYLALMAESGLTQEIEPITSKSSKQHRIFINSLLFSAGLLIVFMIFGLTASQIGNLFSRLKGPFSIVGGIFLVLMGLLLLDKLPIFKFLKQDFKLPLQLKSFNGIYAFIAGIFFGFGWSPCIGPMLAVVIYFASKTETAFLGTFMLLLYGLGIVTPFILIGLLFERIWPVIKKYSKLTKYLRIFSAFIIILMGLLLMFNRFAAVENLLTRNTKKIELYFNKF